MMEAKAKAEAEAEAEDVIGVRCSVFGSRGVLHPPIKRRYNLRLSLVNEKEANEIQSLEICENQPR